MFQTVLNILIKIFFSKHKNSENNNLMEEN
jgi:hypothetical protein